MALADLLTGADPRRPLWAEVGRGLVAVDTLVHAFLHRTGLLARNGAAHGYGPACHRPGGCAGLLRALAAAVDAREVNPAFPPCYPRLLQHAVWRYCAAGGLDVCNGNRIDDRAPCGNLACALHRCCARLPLRPGRRAVAGARRTAPRPFRQGDLDGLCGAYAVVNAVRLAALPHRRLRRAACAALFGELVDELAEAGRLRDRVTRGMGAGKVARLLRRAKLWLDVEFELVLEVERPFRGGEDPDPGACLRLLAGHLDQAGTAAIVGTEDHWTVVRAVRGGRLVLADSHDPRYFVAAKALGDDDAPSRLHLSGTFLLRITKPS